MQEILLWFFFGWYIFTAVTSIMAASKGKVGITTPDTYALTGILCMIFALLILVALL